MESGVFARELSSCGSNQSKSSSNSSYSEEDVERLKSKLQAARSPEMMSGGIDEGSSVGSIWSDKVWLRRQRIMQQLEQSISVRTLCVFRLKIVLLIYYIYL